MNESFDQQAAHTPASPTGSRQEAQSCGSAMSTTSPKVARNVPAMRASRVGRVGAVPSPVSIGLTLSRLWCVLNAVMTQWCMAESPIIFDQPLLRVRRRRAERLGASEFLVERVAEDIAERLSVVLRQFDLAVDLGTPGNAVRRALAASGKVGTVIAASPFARGPLAVVADEETLPFRDGALDLVVSALSLQFANDLPGVLVQIRRALRPDGLFLAALVGGDTLTELRQAFAQAEAEIEDGISPRVAPFADVRELGALLQRAGFALPVTDVDRLTARYASPIDL